MLCVCEGEEQNSGEIEIGVVAVDTGSGDIIYDSFVDDKLRSQLETVRILFTLSACMYFYVYVSVYTCSDNLIYDSFVDDKLRWQLETVRILFILSACMYLYVYVSVYTCSGDLIYDSFVHDKLRLQLETCVLRIVACICRCICVCVCMHILHFVCVRVYVGLYTYSGDIIYESFVDDKLRSQLETVRIILYFVCLCVFLRVCEPKHRLRRYYL
jgi:hypothetical protein